MTVEYNESLGASHGPKSVGYKPEESMYDEVTRRVRQLRRKSYHWIKAAPYNQRQMCAVVDNIDGQIVHQISDATLCAINEWMMRSGYHHQLIDYNDVPSGAQSVEDVIVVLEKFAAEL